MIVASAGVVAASSEKYASLVFGMSLPLSP